MEAYKFETTITENGTIKVPKFQKIKNKKVEVVLLFKPEIEEKSKEQETKEFLDKWFGFFSEIDTDDARYNAIIGKDK
jgi:hypothetical protein